MSHTSHPLKGHVNTDMRIVLYAKHCLAITIVASSNYETKVDRIFIVSTAKWFLNDDVSSFRKFDTTN